MGLEQLDIAYMPCAAVAGMSAVLSPGTVDIVTRSCFIQVMVGSPISTVFMFSNATVYADLAVMQASFSGFFYNPLSFDSVRYFAT